jgi:hypothetical protein
VAVSELELFAEVPDTQSAYSDFEVLRDSTYYYAVATVDLNAQTPQGPSTVALAATPNLPPFVVGDTAHFVSPNFVTVQFNEPMGISILDPNNYWVAGNDIQPRSVVSDMGGKRSVLTFDATFADTTYRLVIHELFDLQGSPLSTLNDTVFFDVGAALHTQPYLISAAATNGLREVVLNFSQPLAHDPLLSVANYSITVDPASPIGQQDDIVIADANVDSIWGLNPSPTVTLLISEDTPLGAFGRIYRVTANNLITEADVPIDTLHNSATLNFSAQSIGGAFVFPNPFSPESGVSYVTFANLTQNAEIHILSLSGILVKKIEVNNNLGGGVSWDLKNERGEPVGSGIYLYYIENGDDSIWGKLAVVR